VSTVVFSAHIDDAVFSSYTLLGPDTTVVTVLAGVPPVGVAGDWDVEGGTSDSAARVLERREEDKRALARSGCRVVHLDFADSQYCGQPGVETPTVESIAAGVRDLVAAAEAVYAPAGIFNLDHKLVRDALLSASPDATLYADIPCALHPDMGGFELPPELSWDGRERREVRLDAELVAAKIESANCYTTQLEQLTSFYGPYLDEGGLGLEVYWDAPES
jgi:hypothetical protein